MFRSIFRKRLNSRPQSSRLTCQRNYTSNIRPGNYRIFCVIYRPGSHKMKQFVLDQENPLNILRSLKDDSMLFGDFNNDTIVESEQMKDYENLLTAFVYR